MHCVQASYVQLSPLFEHVRMFIHDLSRSPAHVSVLHDDAQLELAEVQYGISRSLLLVHIGGSTCEVSWLQPARILIQMHGDVVQHAPFFLKTKHHVQLDSSVATDARMVHVNGELHVAFGKSDAKIGKLQLYFGFYHLMCVCV
jgi:hypothetical protein